MKLFDQQVTRNETTAEIHREDRNYRYEFTKHVLLTADRIGQHSCAEYRSNRANNRTQSGDQRSVINRCFIKDISVVIPGPHARPCINATADRIIRIIK
ncbi:hypothetical protein D3C84_1057300 [compost metagenome]